jgi:membrane protein DedA with SNARE-associated domain
VLNILQSYRYLAVFVLVGLESFGIPLPGETMLLVAAIYAGTTQQHAIGGVIAAALGAVLGDNLGYWAGREVGFRMLRRYGHFMRLDEGALI